LKTSRWIPILSLACLWLGAGPLGAVSPPPDKPDALQAAVAEAELARDLAVRAVDNAYSAHADAAAALVKALQSGDAERMRQTRRRLDAAAGDAAESATTAEEVLSHAVLCLRAIESGKELLKSADGAGDPREREKSAKQAQRLAESAAAEARKAMRLAQELKQKWLVPSAATNSAAPPLESPPGAGSSTRP